jgi:hypothetical protein
MREGGHNVPATRNQRGIHKLTARKRLRLQDFKAAEIASPPELSQRHHRATGPAIARYKTPTTVFATSVFLKNFLGWVESGARAAAAAVVAPWTTLPLSSLGDFP